MFEPTFHARSLRAIGQDLEAHGITQFNLTSSENGYLVRELPRAVDSNASRGLIGKRAGRNADFDGPAELAYTVETIERLDEIKLAALGRRIELPIAQIADHCFRPRL